MLTEVGHNIWIAEGGSVRFLGVPYPTRMTVVRLVGGSLWIHSPIALDKGLAAKVDSLGAVRYLVSPNKLHHLFIGDWAKSWPEARTYASPGLTTRRKDLRFDSELGDDPDPAWASEIDQVIFRGSFAMEEAVFFHRASRTLIVTDLIQKFDPESLAWPQRLLMKLDGLLGPDGSTPREWRLTFWNRKAARRALRQALDWNPERIILAHGTWVRTHGSEALQRSLRWLKP
jgi:hypothetical protein